MLALTKLQIIFVSTVLVLCSCSPIDSVQTSLYRQVKTDTTVSSSFVSSSPFPSNAGGFYRNEIPLRVVRSFLRRFEDAVDVSWSRTKAGLYIAEYANDSVDTKIDYQPDGSWSNIWMKYAKFPEEITTRVKNYFSGYNVTQVAGLVYTWDSETIVYNVIIRNGDNCKVLKICNGLIEIKADFSISMGQ